MPMRPAHYFILQDSLTDRAGDLPASYHLVEDGEAFDVPQPPQSIAAPLSGSEAAIAFNGQNSFACVPKAPAASGLCFWVCPESVEGAQVFLSRGVSYKDQTSDFSIGHRDGRLRITFGAEVWRAADRHFESGDWIHIALLFDGDAPQVFINGEQLLSSQVVRPRTSTIDSKILASGCGAMLLGAEPSGNAMPETATEAAAFGLRRFFDGSLDGLGLWNRDAAAEGLTAAAIRRLASDGPPDLAGLADAPETLRPDPAAPGPMNGQSAPAPTADTQPVSETPAPRPEPEPEGIKAAKPAPEVTETATSRPSGPNVEIWNELKDLVTSINDDITDEADNAVMAVSEADPAPAVPEPVEDVAETPGEVGEEPAAAVSETPEPVSGAFSTEPVQAVAEDAAPVVADNLAETDASEEEPEKATGLLSTLAELERSAEATPEPEVAEPDEPAELIEQDTPVLLLTAAKLAEPDGFHGPPDMMFDSNAALASALTEECAKAGNDRDDQAAKEQEYGLDIPVEAAAAPAVPAEPKAISEVIAKPAPAASPTATGNNDEELSRKLREALTAPEEPAESRSRFRLFGSRKKRDSSLPDLRNIRPHFGQKSGKPAQSETDGLPPIFSYKITGAFADRVVDFGSPVRVKLVPDYGTTTPVPQPSADTVAPRRRQARPRTPTPSAAFDELMDDQADELLFR